MESTHSTPDNLDQATGRRMLIAYDGTSIAANALRQAAVLLDAQSVEIITAWEPLTRTNARAASMTGSHQPTFAGDGDVAYEHALNVCEEGIELAESLGLDARAHMVEHTGNIAQAIADAAEELEVDVIVSGTRGISGVKSWFANSTAANILQVAHCPVFVVPSSTDSG